METATINAKTVERLKASKKEFEERNTREGHAAGREWAMQYADYGELKNLWNQLAIESIESLYYEDRTGEAASETLAAWIIGIDPKSCTDSTARQFWESALGDDQANRICDQHFAEAFVVGAQDVWAEVESQL